MYWLQASGVELALSVFTAVLIIACPCALALSTPFTLGSALNIFSVNGIFIKNHLLIENLSKATAVVFDKTGTLTNVETDEIHFQGRDLEEKEISWVKSVCKNSIHPLSRKINKYLYRVPSLSPTDFHEIPGKGIFAIVDGNRIVLGSSSFLSEQSEMDSLEIPEIDFSGSKVHLMVNGVYKGFFGIREGLRTGISELLASLKAHLTIFLLSGDNDGQKSEFTKHFVEDDSLLFNKKPEEKLDFITSLQKESEQVIMVGDGLNDAGALKKSDFGIALSDDVSSFSPACDAILEGDSLYKLKDFIVFSKACMNIIIASFVISLLYNTIGLGFAVTGHLSPLVAAILMPVSSISVMVFTFLTTRYFARKRGLAIWK